MYWVYACTANCQFDGHTLTVSGIGLPQNDVAFFTEKLMKTGHY